MLGGLLWGGGRRIYLSLDRGDLWDETVPAPYALKDPTWNLADMKKLIATDAAAYYKKYGKNGPLKNSALPSKIPGGRLMLEFGPEKKAEMFTLDLQKAVGSLRFTDGSRLRCFFPSTERVGLMLADDPNVTLKFFRPYALDTLPYPAARFGKKDGMSWMVQQAAEGFEYATLTAERKVGTQLLIAVAITTNAEDPDPLALAKRRAQKALDEGFDKMLVPHEKWWSEFWATSSVSIPDARIQRLYNLCKYYYGAASRPDAPSMPLQAVWTQDNGALPPWRGDYHHDLNTEMTYIAYHTAGLTHSGLSFINHMWRLLPQYRKFAKSFYGVDGGHIAPTVMTLSGRPCSTWQQYGVSPMFSIWIGQSFYLHWKYTMDEKFLRERAYPFLSGVLKVVTSLLEERNGKLYLPLSSSAEIFDDTMRAYLKPNSNQDLSMMQWAFEAMAEMSGALGKNDARAYWLKMRGKLDKLHTDKNGVLMYSSNEPFNEPHRHHALMMAIHPFGTLNIDGTDEDRQVIRATLDHAVKLGYRGFWTGFTFAWFSSFLSRAGLPEQALEHLTIFERACISKNGFHLNGDMLKSGLTNFIWRNFTIEGDFLAMEAVHDMLLQSWPVSIAKDPVPVIRLFPAMPWRWHEASFTDLRAQGGFIVSATWKRNATTDFKIRATVDGELRLRDNFGGRTPKFSRDVKKVGRNFVLRMKAGDVVTGTLPLVERIPLQPEASIVCEKRMQRIENLAKKREANWKK